MRYQWSAINQEGELVYGAGWAISILWVRYRLKIGRLIPLFIQKSDLPVLKGKERRWLLEQLAMMLAASIPLLQALELMAEGSAGKHSKQLLRIAAHRVLTDGGALSTVLKELNIVDRVQCQLIRAGELSGTLCVVLQQLVTELNADERRRQKLRKLLSYPMALLLIALLVVSAFLHWILPQFAELFHSMQLELPLITRWLLQAAVLIKKDGLWVTMIVGGLLAVVAYYYCYSDIVRHYLDDRLLHCPGLGRLILYRCMQKMFTVMSLLLSAGVHLVPTLTLLSDVLNHSSYQRAIKTVQKKVTGGLELHKALRDTSLFETAALQFIMLGERSGQLIDVTAQLGRYYDRCLVDMLDKLGRRLEPTIILLLGVVIGVLVLGMYLPIFQLGEVVR